MKRLKVERSRDSFSFQKSEFVSLLFIVGCEINKFGDEIISILQQLGLVIITIIRAS